MSPRLQSVVVVRSDNYVLSRARIRNSRHPYWSTDRHFLYLVHGWDFDEYCESVRAKSLSYEGVEPSGHSRELRLHDDMIIPPGDPALVSDIELIELVNARFNCKTVEIRESAEGIDYTGPDRFDRSEIQVPILSVGGWCGPAMCLRMLGILETARPFDSSYTSLDRVIDVLEGRTQAYLPARPFARQQLTFRRIEKAVRLGRCPALAHASEGSIFSHHDFDAQPETHEKMLGRADRMVDFLSSHQGEILLVRAATNPEWTIEKSKAIQLLDMLERRYPNLRTTLLLILHDQHVGTVRMSTFDPRVDLWCVHGFVDGVPPSLGRDDNIVIEEYCRIVLASLRSRHSEHPADLRQHTVRGHDEHWIF